MKIRLALTWILVMGVVLLAFAGCTCPPQQALPDISPTVGSAQDAPPDGGMPEGIELTSQAQSTIAAMTMEAAQGGQGSTESPVVTPTTMPPTAEIQSTTVPPTAVIYPTAVPVATTGPTISEVMYVVQRGDTLYSIARRYGTTVEAIASANGIANPSLIQVGQTLRISSSGGVSPIPSGGTTYVVQPGDNLFRIALRYGMSYLYLAQYNGIMDPSHIYVGQVIRIPPH